MTRARDLSNDEANGGGATPPFVAGKNKIINGDFGIWQRGTSITGAGYSVDRWFTVQASGQTNTVVSRQTFTPGNAITGYEPPFFSRFSWTGTATGYFWNATRLEDVRILAGQTVTLSFWGKATSAAQFVSQIQQNYGSGGSSLNEVASASMSFTTSWQRFSWTFTVPSISGKTIGTNSYLEIRPLQFAPGTGTNDFDIWGVQLEAGSLATPFTTASGTIQGELALCQRYYWRNTQSTSYERFGNGFASATNAVVFQLPLKVTMRTAVTSVDYNGMTAYDGITQSGTGVVAINAASSNVVDVSLTSISGLTQYRPYALIASGTSGAYLGFSAEL